MRTTLAAPVASACALPGRRPAPWLEHPGVKPGGNRHHLPQQRVGATFVTAWSHAHSTHNTHRHTQPMNTHHNATTVHIAHHTHTHTHTHATDRRAEGIGRRSECGRHFPGVSGVSGVSEVRSQTLIRHQAPIITFISHPSPAHIKQLHIVVPSCTAQPCNQKPNLHVITSPHLQESERVQSKCVCWEQVPILSHAKDLGSRNGPQT